MKEVRLVVLSGPSGAGKSTAIKALEDMGFFCVDNMPVSLLPTFMELLARTGEINRVAAVVDVREGEFLKDFTRILAEVRKAGYKVEILYLEASDDSLVRRFSETRRRHPIAAMERPLDGIRLERELLNEVKDNADKVLDTTYFTVHQLRDLIKEYFSGPLTCEMLTLNLVSFGFRYGLPVDADLVIDTRFLPNPFFVDSLRWHNGLDGDVKEFVLSREETKEFLKRFEGLISYLIPLYWKEGKSYLTIAVGCTGGKHRSVVITEALASGQYPEMVDVKKRHRDIQKS